MNVRLADERELNRISALRKQLFDLHACERPEVFRTGGSRKLQDALREIWSDPEQDIAVAEQGGTICGYAVLHHIRFAETPATLARDFLNVDEFCVDEACQGQGVAKAMIGFIREYAAGKGFHRVELCVWEFNRRGPAVYDAAGFRTYKRNMELRL